MTLFHSLVDYLVDTTATSTENLVSDLRAIICQTPVSWTTCRTTLLLLRDEMKVEYFEDMDVSYEEANSALQHLLCFETWELEGRRIEADQDKDLNYWERVFQAECPWRRRLTRLLRP